MIERIKHNLEYNDDRIFEGLSIFELKSDENEDSKLNCQTKPEENKLTLSQDEKDQSFNEYSDHNDQLDVEYNQGIMSNCEESGGIIGMNPNDQNKDLIFETQVSLIQCFEDLKENSCIEKDLEEIDFDKVDHADTSSGFMKLNDSLIKNREVWKDKTEKRNSYKQIDNFDKAIKNDSFSLREDSAIKEFNFLQNHKNSQLFEDKNSSIDQEQNLVQSPEELNKNEEDK